MSFENTEQDIFEDPFQLSFTTYLPTHDKEMTQYKNVWQEPCSCGFLGKLMVEVVSSRPGTWY